MRLFCLALNVSIARLMERPVSVIMTMSSGMLLQNICAQQPD